MKVGFLIISLFVLLGFGSCTKDEPTPPDVSAADIFGSLKLFDEGQTQIDNAGMAVSIEGTVPLITDTSDSDGNFRLPDVPFGLPTIVYSKEGYGTYKNMGFQHNNTGHDNELPTPVLGQLSSTEVTDVTFTLGTDNVRIFITIDNEGTVDEPKYVRLFFGSFNTVDYNEYTSTFKLTLITPVPNEVLLTPIQLSNLGFPAGETVFVKVYGDSFYSSDYFDPGTLFQVFPNVNPNSAPEVTFVSP
jgi:hypothetical protein